MDREKLFDISGRSRKPQMALAEKYGIKDYPNPAGGCLLTDSQFSVKLRDLLKHNNLTMAEIEFLKVGRHFRLSQDAKAIIGRNRDDNTRILKLAGENDVILRLKDIPGPVIILRGKHTVEDIEMAGAITARYSKARNYNSVKISQYIVDGNGRKKPFPPDEKKEAYFLVRPVEDSVISKCII